MNAVVAFVPATDKLVVEYLGQSQCQTLSDLGWWRGRLRGIGADALARLTAAWARAPFRYR